MRMPRRGVGRLHRATALATPALVFAWDSAFAVPPTARRPIPSAAAAPVRVSRPALGGARDRLIDTLSGRSGTLRALVLSRAKPVLASPTLERHFGDSRAARAPGVHPVRDAARSHPFSINLMVSVSALRRGRIGAYRLGRWPTVWRVPGGPA